MGKNLRDKAFNIVFGGDTINRLVGYFNAALAMDRAAVGSDWSSGEVLPVSLTDQDLNKNSLIAEDLIIAKQPGCPDRICRIVSYGLVASVSRS